MATRQCLLLALLCTSFSFLSFFSRARIMKLFSVPFEMTHHRSSLHRALRSATSVLFICSHDDGFGKCTVVKRQCLFHNPLEARALKRMNCMDRTPPFHLETRVPTAMTRLPLLKASKSSESMHFASSGGILLKRETAA